MRSLRSFTFSCVGVGGLLEVSPTQGPTTPSACFQNPPTNPTHQLGRAALATVAHLPWIPVTHRKPANQAGLGVRDHTEAPLNVTGA